MNSMQFINAVFLMKLFLLQMGQFYVPTFSLSLIFYPNIGQATRGSNQPQRIKMIYKNKSHIYIKQMCFLTMQMSLFLNFLHPITKCYSSS